jgi:hypothetical protein
MALLAVRVFFQILQAVRYREQAAAVAEVLVLVEVAAQAEVVLAGVTLLEWLVHH